MTTYSESNPIKIMLIDDSETFREISMKLLERYPNIKVVCSASGAKEALDCKGNCPPDVILLDLDMPGKSGIEFIPELRILYEHSKIIILTLMDGSSFRRLARESGADGFVTKHQLVTNLIPMIYKLTEYSISNN